jgi:hypothetical protein
MVTQCEGFRNAIEQGLSVVTPSAHAFMLRAHRALMSLHTSVLSSSCLSIRLCGALALGVLLANVRDGKTYDVLDAWPRSERIVLVVRTRRQTLLELLGLVGVLEDKGVQVG